jgi:hypothetical protein
MNGLHKSFLKRLLDAPDPAEETCAAQNKASLIDNPVSICFCPFQPRRGFGEPAPTAQGFCSAAQPVA